MLEFCEAPSGGGSGVEFPRGWIGTTTSVRVSIGGRRTVLSLGRRNWQGPAARGALALSESVALVVDGGTGHLLKETGDGTLWVAPLRIWPLLEVIESTPPHHGLVLVSEQEMEWLTPAGLFEVPMHATDGFRSVLSSGGVVSGEGWICGEWREFVFNLEDLKVEQRIAWENLLGPHADE